MSTSFVDRRGLRQLLCTLMLAGMLASCAPGAEAVGGKAADGAASTTRLWTPPSIASGGYESSPTFSPDGRTMLYLAADGDFRNYRIMQVQCEKGGWGRPFAPSFAMPLPVIEADPFITRDGKRLYYVSSRHSPADQDFDIWYVDRKADGDWGAPHRLPEPVNSRGAELLPRTDAEGRLYFGSSRAGSRGGGDIYIATEASDGTWQVENAGSPISTDAYEYEAEISRDGRSMVVVADRGTRSHLYRYVLRDGRWVETGQIPARDEVFQVGPLLSPNGDRLLFAEKHADRSGEMLLTDLTRDPDRSWPPACE